MIYFDNASTSFPKAPNVSSSIKDFIDGNCFNINRGGYKAAHDTAEIVFQTREMVAEFFSARSGKNIVFTGGITQALNMVLKGILHKGDKVLTSTMEHNAVMRPLKQLVSTGVEIEYFCCNGNGEADIVDFEKKLREEMPKLVVVTHASNICGSIMPISEMGRLCLKYGVFFAVDAAQTAGVIKIDVTADNIDLLCFTAHKGLLSVQGLGGLAVSDKAADIIEPLISGGTGSFSSTTEVPKLLPDKLEAGTLNLPGIVGLNTSLKYIDKIGIDEIFRAESTLQRYFEEGIKSLFGLACADIIEKDCKTNISQRESKRKRVIAGNALIRLIGANAKNRCAVTSLDFFNEDNGEVAFRLDEEYGIMTRSGMHCAPIAHKTLGSFPKGTLRFSFGHTNTTKEVDILLDAIKTIIKP